jgi:hypothetical protein
VNKKYPATIALWIMGYTIVIIGLGITGFGFLQNCESIACQVESVFWKTTGFLSLFIGAVLIVLGYSHKAKEELKDLE